MSGWSRDNVKAVKIATNQHRMSIGDKSQLATLRTLPTEELARRVDAVVTLLGDSSVKVREEALRLLCKLSSAKLKNHAKAVKKLLKDDEWFRV